MSAGLERSAQRIGPFERMKSPSRVWVRPSSRIVALMCWRPTRRISMLVAVLSLTSIISASSRETVYVEPIRASHRRRSPSRGRT
jgi:hypothetical protein